MTRDSTPETGRERNARSPVAEGGIHDKSRRVRRQVCWYTGSRFIFHCTGKTHENGLRRRTQEAARVTICIRQRIREATGVLRGILPARGTTSPLGNFALVIIHHINKPNSALARVLHLRWHSVGNYLRRKK